MSLYSIKQTSQQGAQSWSSSFNVGKGIKDFYASLGDAFLVGTISLPTLLDGPEKVFRYGNLVIGDGTTATSVTAAARCKGMTLICDSLTVKANATLTMAGRGARVITNDDPFFPFIDFAIPDQITLSSDKLSLAQALGVIKQNGFAPWDQGTWQSIVAGLFGFNLAVSKPGQTFLMRASGCGSSAAGVLVSNNSLAGTSGAAGTNGGTGSGGSGGVWSSTYQSFSAKSGAGCPYSGGSGSGAVSQNNYHDSCHAAPVFSGPGGRGGVQQYNMPSGGFSLFDTTPADSSNEVGYGGGGAGNPGGKCGLPYAGQTDGLSGTGGKLVIICYGAINVLAGGKIEANGVAGGSGYTAAGSGHAGGGGSGGGHISIISPSITNAGTIQAAGGAGGIGVVAGGAGGAGSVVTKTFIEMGW